MTEDTTNLLRRRLLETSFANSPIAIYAKDIAGKFLAVNQSTLTLLGLDSEDQVIGKSDFDFLTESQAQSYRADEMQVLTTGSALIGKRERFTQSDGATKWYLTDKVPLIDDDGVIIGIIGSTRDVTVMLQPEELFKHSVEACGCVVWTAFVEKTDKEYIWHLDIANEDTAKKLWPVLVRPDETYGSALRSARFAEDAEKCLEIQMPFFGASPSKYSVDYRVTLVNEDFRWITESASVEPMSATSWRVVAVCVDNTSKLKLEQDFRLAEERQRMAVEGGDFGTWQANIQTGDRYWSDKCKELLGLDNDFVISPDAFWNTVYSEDVATVRSLVQKCIVTGGPVVFEYRTQWPDGSIHWILTKGRSYLDAHGRPHRMEGLIQNIDHRKAEEQALALAWKREHATAHTLQKALLQLPPPNAFENIELQTLYRSATADLQVGGDLLDAYPLPDRRVALVVGDVSGKGLIAAARTADVKFALRAFLSEDISPANAVTKLNRYVSQWFAMEPNFGDAFVCITVVVIAIDSGEVKVSIAGAEAPILLSDQEIVQLDMSNLPVGVDTDTKYEELELHLKAGDRLLMLTDGITEARNAGHCFGMEGVLETIGRARPWNNSGNILEMIAQDATDYSSHGLTDDVCMLMAHWNPIQNT